MQQVRRSHFSKAVAVEFHACFDMPPHKSGAVFRRQRVHIHVAASFAAFTFAAFAFTQFGLGAALASLARFCVHGALAAFTLFTTFTAASC